MHAPTIPRKIRLLPMLALVLLAACRGEPDGLYANGMGDLRIDFGSGGKAEVHMMGKTQPAQYSRDGQQLKLQMEDGTAFNWNINEDGTIESLFGRMHKCEERFDPACEPQPQR